jgi:hypothetical protein
LNKDKKVDNLQKKIIKYLNSYTKTKSIKIYFNSQKIEKTNKNYTIKMQIIQDLDQIIQELVFKDLDLIILVWNKIKTINKK